MRKMAGKLYKNKMSGPLESAPLIQHASHDDEDDELNDIPIVELGGGEENANDFFQFLIAVLRVMIFVA